MSRRKKSRSLKDKLNIKTGSKKDFIEKGEQGRIPSKNKLAKHKKRQKSAYQRFIESKGLKDTTAGGPRPGAGTPEPIRETPVDHGLRKDEDERGFDQLSGDELLDKFDRS